MMHRAVALASIINTSVSEKTNEWEVAWNIGKKMHVWARNKKSRTVATIRNT